MNKKVLHVVADIPNEYKKRNTKAVLNLIEKSKSFDHYTIAIHKTTNPFKTGLLENDQYSNITIKYWGGKFGILLGLSMFILSVRIGYYLRKNKIDFDIIHAHKMAFEGMVAYFLSGYFKKPFVVSVRGEAESKVIKYKPHYRWILKKIVKKSKSIFLISMWMEKNLIKFCGLNKSKVIELPNICKVENIKPIVAKKCGFVSIMHLKLFEKKGFFELLSGYKLYREQGGRELLKIVGDGDLEVRDLLNEKIRKMNLGGFVTIEEGMDQDSLFYLISESKAMILTSFNETFGMVYVESLLNLTPIIYSKGTGFSGYIEDKRYAISVNPNDFGEIAASLKEIDIFNVEAVDELSSDIISITKRFSGDEIIDRYESAIKKCI
jgi:glycosyltransferase involved in cell wall biosynthesis